MTQTIPAFTIPDSHFAPLTEHTDLAREETFDLATRYNRRQMAIQARKDMDNSVGLVTYTIVKVNAESGLCLIPQKKIPGNWY